MHIIKHRRRRIVHIINSVMRALESLINQQRKMAKWVRCDEVSQVTKLH